LCQRTLQRTENPVEQAILNREADKRLLAAFISRINGVPGKHARLQRPDMIEKALSMAIVATNTETSERDGDRNETASKRNVFAVRGDRGSLQGPCVWNPCNKSQEGKYRAAVDSLPRVSPRRGAWKVTRAFRAGSRTSVGEGSASGPRNDDDCYARCELKGICQSICV
jgi:hypothetical protein